MWMKQPGCDRAISGRRNNGTLSGLLLFALTIAVCCALQPAWGGSVIFATDGSDGPSGTSGGIFEYDLSGNPLRTFDTDTVFGSLTPRFYDVEVGPDGNVYVSSFGFQSVYRWDYASGDYAGKPGAIALGASLYMQFRPNGNLLVSAENVGGPGISELQEGVSDPWANLGSFSKDSSQNPTGGHYRAVSLGPDGNYYVTRGTPDAAVERYLSDGSRDASYSITGLIAYSGDIEFFGDDMFITQQGAPAIKRYDRATGTPKVDIPRGASSLQYAEDMLVLPDGTLLVANHDGPAAPTPWEPREILKFDAATGAYLGIFATSPDGNAIRGLAYVPAAAADASSIVSIDVDSNDMINVTFSSVSGQVYDVQLESDLVDGTWTNDPSNENISGTGTSVTVNVNSDPDEQNIRVSTESE
jgi:hypothetical protein